MNAVAQRAHRTVTQSLDERLAVVESLTEQLLRNDSALANASVAQERRTDVLMTDGQETVVALGARLDEAHRRIDVVGGLLDETHRRFSTHERLTFWGRLRWLLVGR